MKKIFTFTLLLNLFVGLAQVNVTSSAISIQGIAKTGTNVAIPNVNGLSCTFELFYLGDGNAEETIVKETHDVNTDAYGVFQYALPINSDIFYKIANTEAYIKVTHGGETFITERLSAVPYAFYAQNGFMTGAIVAYTGDVSSVPSGWLYCDGSQIPTTNEYQALRSMVGNNVPDLRGWFLRGSGENGDNDTYVGPDLGGSQGSAFKEHLHEIDLTSTSNGAHTHALWVYIWQQKSNQPEGQNDIDFRIVADDHAVNLTARPDDLEEAGNHAHVLIGDTKRQSQVEQNNVWSSTPNTSYNVRPVNYGVAYLIKI